MEKIEFIPSGICAKKMIIEIENDLVKSYSVIGGCPGNSLGISALIINMHIDDAINRLTGIKCGNKNTSCPDQLSKALITYKNKKTSN